MTIEFNRRLEAIPYYPAADAYGDGRDLVLLASNETPFAPPPAVREAIADRLATLNRYPDPDKSELRRRIAARCDVPSEMIVVGNGSCEILLAAAQALLEPGAEVVFAWPSFSVYPQLAALTGAREIRVPLDSDDRHDLDALAREVTAATRLVLVCNPNNPTGTALPLDAIDELAAALPRHVCLLVDEAYVEFSALQDPDESLELVRRHPNVVLLRTFSKVYGLCGLRCGYAIGPESFRIACEKVRQPFTVNTLAQAAAAVAIDLQDEVERRVERTAVEREHVVGELRARGLRVADSQANFCWVELGGRDDRTICDELARRGVIVRAGSALGGPGHLRVTFGTRAENDRFLAALDAALAAGGGDRADRPVSRNR
ncbi:MAG: histidinol-phosphate transaminase [Thermoleophilum sp.]|nr:histidinol-phosphate transaminase [Thermoleophilum sp.]